MSSKLKQRCLLWLVFIILGLWISFCSHIYGISPVAATTAPVTVAQAEDAASLEIEGKNYYLIAQFHRAIASWQQAYKIYTESEDTLNQGRILSNIALAYSQLNNEPEATNKINASLSLLAKSNTSIEDRVPVLAQVLNNQGILLLDRGKPQQAIALWQQAKINYELVDDNLGIIRASINQASAFKELGHYRRAVKTLESVEEKLLQQPDSALKATGLRSYGDILRFIGRIQRSQAVLEDSLLVASKIDNPYETVKTSIALGNTYKVSNRQKAEEIYARGLKTCQSNSDCQQTDLILQIYLAQLNLLSNSSQWQSSYKSIAAIQNEFTRLPNTKANLDRQINFANVLVKLNRQSSNKKQIKAIPRLSAIKEFLQNTVQQAEAIDYQKAQSYSWGLLGQIEEQLQQWKKAREYTQKALVLGQQLNAPEIVYLWQWQLGRIDRALDDLQGAIARYSRAVELLKSLSRDLVAIDPDVQYSFREGVEPVYRELVNLLLTSDSGAEISQANLKGAREVIESLQLAELNNFFREACLDDRVVNIDSIDRQAAVIYPIILRNRLEVILSLPDRPLKNYTAQIGKTELEAIIEEFRQNVVVRSRRNFYRPSQKLYDLLIRPALSDLKRAGIETIVFVPDGSLRNIPFSALYDGRQYAIENYNIALTPGLQLLSPRPLEQVKLKTIAAGITESRQGFSSLDYVDLELKKIKNTVNSVVLLNEDFTTESLQQQIQFSNYPIVHIATHGQFSSSIENTFLVAWDERININELDNILRTRNLRQEDAIELLVLSACQTATGDKRAALGLAGIAVRAGARSTLATLWSVNDRATTQLMNDFYDRLSNPHLTKADAVRQAQLSLLHTRGYEHPFYWSSYVLLGNWL